MDGKDSMRILARRWHISLPTPDELGPVAIADLTAAVGEQIREIVDKIKFFELSFYNTSCNRPVHDPVLYNLRIEDDERKHEVNWNCNDEGKHPEVADLDEIVKLIVLSGVTSWNPRDESTRLARGVPHSCGRTSCNETKEVVVGPEARRLVQGSWDLVRLDQPIKQVQQRDLRHDDELQIAQPDGSDRIGHGDGVLDIVKPFASHHTAVRRVGVVAGSPPLFLGCEGSPDPTQLIGLAIGECERRRPRLGEPLSLHRLGCSARTL